MVVKSVPGLNELDASVAIRPKTRSFEIVVVMGGPVTAVPELVVTVATVDGSNGLTGFAPERENPIPLPELAPVKYTVGIVDPIGDFEGR